MLLKPLNLAYSKKKLVSFTAKLFLYVLLIGLVLVFLYPFFFMIITSLKSYSDLIDSSVKWIVNSINFRNYSLAYTILDYPKRFLNTVLVAGLSTIGHVISCSVFGYVFARYRYKSVHILFIMVILFMVMPIQTLIIPSYISFSRLGWIDTYLPLVLPTFFGYGLKGAIFIFLFRQFFLSLPVSLEEAARLDGCGPLKTFTRIAFPSASASTLVCVVLSFTWHWNDYFEPGMYLSKASKFLLPQVLPGIYTILEQLTKTPEKLGYSINMDDAKEFYNAGLIMAATVLCLLPPLIGYFIVQRWFMESVEQTGITGE